MITCNHWIILFTELIFSQQTVDYKITAKVSSKASFEERYHFVYGKTSSMDVWAALPRGSSTQENRSVLTKLRFGYDICHTMTTHLELKGTCHRNVISYNS